MTTAEAAVLWVYGGIVAIWPIRWLVLEFVLRRQRTLTRSSPQYNQAEPPLVSAILPAKDEEATLGDCLNSVSRQTYPNLEIVVVDDRSIDRTGAIAREIAGHDARIHVLTIDHLPPGWTGKTHALDCAIRMARGSWFLFVDADTVHEPESLAVMMEFARTEDAALVSLLPELRCESFWESVVQPMGAITLMVSFPLHVVHSERSRLGFANGQYILVERAAYEAAGGHRAVSDRFVEDIAIAGRVKSLGLALRVALVEDLVQCRMYSSLGQLVRGWSRIFYDALDRRAWRIAGKLLDPAVFCQSGHVALLAALALLLTGTHIAFASWLALLSILHHMLMYGVFRRVYNISVPGSRFVAWYPVANLVIVWILARSLQMCFTKTVTWRGTEYGAVANRSMGRAPECNSPTTEPVDWMVTEPPPALPGQVRRLGED
jgi:glycosyltransferase involved in cell wall biosynthesis